jgi:hypothetical protein
MSTSEIFLTSASSLHGATHSINMNENEIKEQRERDERFLNGQQRQWYRNTNNFTFYFGEYEGVHIEDVPTSYLKAASGWDLHEYIIDRIEDELESRGIDIYDFDDGREGDRY